MSFPYAEMPRSGFIGRGDGSGYKEKDLATSHNVADTSIYKIYPPGTKIRYYNPALEGWGTCIYLQYSKGGETLAAGYICQPDPALDSLYLVTGDASTFVDLAVAKPNCFALSAMTTLYWGWFWTGGVCPDFYTSSSDRFAITTCTTDDSLTAGDGFGSDRTTNGHLESYDTTAIHSADNHSQAGWVLADDGGSTSDMANLILIDWWP